MLNALVLRKLEDHYLIQIIWQILPA